MDANTITFFPSKNSETTINFVKLIFKDCKRGIQKLRNENNELRTENEELQNNINFYHNRANDLERRIDELQLEVRRLV